MKKLHLLIPGIMIYIFCISCDKKERHENPTLMGTWTYTEDYSKTFDFKNSSDVLINGLHFLYDIEEDSIEFSYNGELYIALKPSKHRFEKLSDTDYLMIEDLDKLQFFNGESGENILFCCIEPNDFVGTWISENDTLIFKTNNRFERKNEIYEYTFTNDSLTIQIIRADIFMGPLKSKYFLDMDTLRIDYSADYYPDILAGELIYKRLT